MDFSSSPVSILLSAPLLTSQLCCGVRNFFPPPSNSSPPTVLALEEIKHGLTHLCLQTSSCMAGLLTPTCWEEQTWEQLCLLLGSLCLWNVILLQALWRCHIGARQERSFASRQGNGMGGELT